MTQPLSPANADPVMWRCKDYADGWITFTSEEGAKRYQADTGCLMQPLYLRHAQRQQEPTADQSWQYARQIVCEEWQRAVKEHGLTPGSVTEKVVALIINRLDGAAFTSTDGGGA